MDRFRLFARLALAALSIVTALALGGLFAGTGWWLPLLGAVLIPHAIGAAAEWRSVHGAFVALIWAITLFLYTVWLTVFADTLFGIPLPGTVSALGRALGDGGAVLRDGVPPVDATAPVVAVAVVGVWLVAVNADWLAFRADAALGALVPSLVLLIASFTLERDSGRLWVAGLWVLAAAMFLATFNRDRMERRRAWLHASQPAPLRSWRVAAVAIAIGATLAAVVVAPRLPGSGAEPIIDVQGLGRGRTVRTDNPLVRLSGRLNQDPAVELFRVTSPSPQYWRLVALEKFDGQEWALDGDTYSGASADQALLDGAREGRETIQQIYEISSLEGRFLPAAYNPVEIDLDDVRVVPEARALIAAETTIGARYAVVSQIPPGSLSAEEVVGTTAPISPLLNPLMELPVDFPSSVRDLAVELTADASTPWEEAKALEAWFANSGEFTYTLEADYGTDTDAIVEFLDAKEGFCEQFAAAYAAMARSLGIPSRVAVGFTPGLKSGSTYAVSTRDAHAWAEVYMPGLGWLAMEPTPAGPQPGQPPTGEVDNRPAAEPGEAPVTTAPTVTTNGRDTVATTTPVTTAEPIDRGAGGPGVVGGSRPWWATAIIVLLGWLLLAGVAAAVVVALKRRRMRAHRAARDPRVSINGAWTEALARLREVGYHPRPSVTPTEVGDHALADDDARARPALHALVEEYVVACYGPNPPAADAAERVWSAYDVLDGELRSRLAPRQRWFHQLDPRPLLTRR